MRMMKSVLLFAGAIAMVVPSAAIADQASTYLCGRVMQADPTLISIGGDYFALGDFFKATIITENPCGATCGTIRAQANTVVVTGTIQSITENSSSWSTAGVVDTFAFGGANGPEASATADAYLTGSRTAGSNHPGYPSGPIDGYTDVGITVVTSTSPYSEATLALTASVETIGTACSEYIPTLPVWGFPVLGIGMLGSAALMLRKRA